MCSARYKTRPGLTYHYTHTHKETKECDVPTVDCGENSLERGSPKQSIMGPTPASVTVPSMHMVPTSMPLSSGGTPMDSSGPPGSGQFQESYLTFLKVPGMLSLNATHPPLLFFYCRRVRYTYFLANHDWVTCT